jgi:hypothetical protein
MPAVIHLHSHGVTKHFTTPLRRVALRQVTIWSFLRRCSPSPSFLAPKLLVWELSITCTHATLVLTAYRRKCSSHPADERCLTVHKKLRHLNFEKMTHRQVDRVDGKQNTYHQPSSSNCQCIASTSTIRILGWTRNNIRHTVLLRRA